jgi:hypothetical protein
MDIFWIQIIQKKSDTHFKCSSYVFSLYVFQFDILSKKVDGYYPQNTEIIRNTENINGVRL